MNPLGQRDGDDSFVGHGGIRRRDPERPPVRPPRLSPARHIPEEFPTAFSPDISPGTRKKAILPSQDREFGMAVAEVTVERADPHRRALPPAGIFQAAELPPAGCSLTRSRLINGVYSGPVRAKIRQASAMLEEYIVQQSIQSVVMGFEPPQEIGVGATVRRFQNRSPAAASRRRRAGASSPSTINHEHNMAQESFPGSPAPPSPAGHGRQAGDPDRTSSPAAPFPAAAPVQSGTRITPQIAA